MTDANPQSRSGLLIWLTALSVALTIAILAFGRNLSARPASSVASLGESLELDAARLKGATGTHVALVIFSDFECPFCRTFANTALPIIEREYVQTGKVVIGFKHLPLPQHRHAIPAAQAAECASEQGRFWDMHDHLFRTQALDSDGIRRHETSIGLDGKRFESCLANPATMSSISADVNQAQRLQLSGTPSFLFGVREGDSRVIVKAALSGTVPMERLRDELDSLLNPGILASQLRRLQRLW